MTILDLSHVAGIQLGGPGRPGGTAVAEPAPAPAEEPETAATPEAPAAPEARRIAPSVLIVDDNVRLAQTVAAYLEMQGFRAHPAHSAEEALLAAQRARFDLVLLDINMPGIDGLEVCRRLLAAAPAMRVLMLTGRDSAEDPLRAAAAGARGLLTKPISLATLREEILRTLTG
jgi:CheY-like chemotaxis protein